MSTGWLIVTGPAQSLRNRSPKVALDQTALKMTWVTGSRPTWPKELCTEIATCRPLCTKLHRDCSRARIVWSSTFCQLSALSLLRMLEGLACRAPYPHRSCIKAACMHCLSGSLRSTAHAACQQDSPAEPHTLLSGPGDRRQQRPGPAQAVWCRSPPQSCCRSRPPGSVPAIGMTRVSIRSTCMQMIWRPESGPAQAAWCRSPPQSCCRSRPPGSVPAIGMPRVSIRSTCMQMIWRPESGPAQAAWCRSPPRSCC